MTQSAKKTFLITGGTSGIGKAFKSLCLAEHHELLSLERHAPKQQPKDQKIIACDLSSPESMANACKCIDQKIDVFVHFAGIMLSKSLSDSSFEDIENMVKVNLTAPIYLVSQVIPKLSDKGLIIMMGSQSAYKGSYDDLYAITKAGIHGMVGSLAPKLAPNKRIINIAPGITRGTRMTDRRSEDDLANATSRVPLNRLAEAKEVAQICMRLTDETFNYMTGNTVDINGGNHIR